MISEQPICDFYVFSRNKLALKMLLILVSATMFCGVLSTDYTDCGSKLVIENVTIDGCSKGDCTILAGTNTSIRLRVHADFNADKITADVFVTIAGMRYDLDVKPSDPCKSFKCPIYSNSDLVYNSTFLADEELVWHTAVPLTLKLFDQQNKVKRQILCVEIDVMVTDWKKIFYRLT